MSDSTHPARPTAVILLTALALAACGAGPSTPPAALAATSRDSAGIRIVELSHTLNVIAAGAAKVYEIEPDLILGAGEDVWFGTVADVESLGGGRFAVLDEREARVQVFDSAGRRVGTLGRPGQGPGELRQPWALAAVGGRLVVRQNQPTQAFTIYGLDGKVLATGPAEPAGDWHRPMFRWPLLEMLGFQMGPEDVSRRLAPFGDSSFLHVLQVDEFAQVDWTSPVEYDAIPTYLISYGLDARVRDTLAVLPGPPTRAWKVERGRTILYAQPLWSGAPVWATGRGWYALGHGDSSHVVVHDLAGDTLLMVRWPPLREAARREHRVDAAKWIASALILNGHASRDLIERQPEAVKIEVEWQERDNVIAADTLATIAAAHGAGRCLFLSGIQPRDWQDGTSLTWVVVDVVDGALERVIRLVPPPDGVSSEYDAAAQRGAAVRTFGPRFAYVSYRNPDGVSMVARYPLPEGCAAAVRRPGPERSPARGRAVGRG